MKPREQGAVGQVGKRGLPGRLAKGTYMLSTWKCYIEDWSVSMASKGWSACSKPGYMVTGLWRNLCASGLHCVQKVKCCQPALMTHENDRAARD